MSNFLEFTFAGFGASSCSFNAEKDFAPFSIANSTKASRVPDVGGGPKTSIFILVNWNYLSKFCGLSCNFDPSSFAGTFLARAR